MRLDMVGRMPSHVLGVLMDLIQKLMGNDGELWLERTKRMLKGENPFAELVSQSAAPATWKDELVAMARRKLKKFSRAWADQVTGIPDVWTPEFLANAAAYNLKPAFLPDADISESFRARKYIKPEPWFYANVRNGNIKNENPTKLRKGWVLADFTVGADYTNGSQTFVDDPWTSLIADLRAKKLIGKNDVTPLGSRFAITWDEWNDCVLAQIASKLLATRAQTSLERAVEFNFIGNVYDPNRGRFNMWEWLLERFEDGCRLFGGHRDDGGLAYVYYYWHALRHVGIAGRPLVSFVQ
jgi:hypothetical protein